MDAIIGTKLGEELGKFFEPILVILVTAAVYCLTSRTVLQSYITAKNVSIPLARPEEPQKKLIVFSKFLRTILFPLLLFSLISIAYGQDMQLPNLLCSTVFFNPMVIATYRLFLSMSKSEKKALFKDSKTGNIIVHLIDASSIFSKLRFILSGAIVAFAFSFNNLAALILVYAAAIAFPSWFFLRNIISLRACTLSLLIWIACTAVIIVILFFIDLHSSTSFDKSGDLKSSWFLSLIPDIERWKQRIIAVEFAFLPQIIINACLRFDYHNGSTTNDAIIVEKGVSSSASVAEEDIKREEPSYVVVSPKLPLEFRKTYYTVSMAAWLFSCLAMMTLIPFSIQPLDFWTYGMFMSIASIFFMLISTLAVAATRKQFRDLWNFSETLTLSKIPSEDDSSSISSDDAVTDNNKFGLVLSPVTFEDNAVEIE